MVCVLQRSSEDRSFIPRNARASSLSSRSSENACLAEGNCSRYARTFKCTSSTLTNLRRSSLFRAASTSLTRGVFLGTVAPMMPNG